MTMLSEEVWEEFLPNKLLVLLRENTNDFYDGPELAPCLPDELLLFEDIYLLFWGTPDSPDFVLELDFLLVVAALIKC
jgi:hypothetical protein